MASLSNSLHYSFLHICQSRTVFFFEALFLKHKQVQLYLVSVCLDLHPHAIRSLLCVQINYFRLQPLVTNFLTKVAACYKMDHSLRRI